MHTHKLENQAIEIVSQVLETDHPKTFDSRSAMELVGYSMSKIAADKAFAKAGFKAGEGRDLVGVIELHDCFAANEVNKTRISTVWLAAYPPIADHISGFGIMQN